MTHVTSNAPTGTPNWLDLGIPDLERAKEFYGALFGWDFQDFGPETGHYHGCFLDGRMVAGMMRNPDESAAAFWWNVFLATDDADGTLERVADAGGTVLMPADDVMELGRMAMAADPVGAPFGLWQGRSHIGSQTVNEPGSFTWNELVTARPKPARDFYTAVFGYTLEAVPGGEIDYTALLRPDGRAVGGIHGEPDAVASSWLTYFEVEDADAAVGRARDAGGAAAEAWDSPYGRMAEVRDPFDVVFRVMRTAEH
ncbi:MULTISPECIES: VOC family protein [Actinomadura]|uniref:VOC family protein n=1 Tax=Actinomadura yumaensis TaxID=111807 RepID=A0ABW2CX00_9ACTN|nr:VOC family protein [Actinomadura sp. J1-007]MWK39215.1 VOC family protein [Actinomadura sp. J1-007]